MLCHSYDQSWEKELGLELDLTEGVTNGDILGVTEWNEDAVPTTTKRVVLDDVFWSFSSSSSRAK